MRTEDFFSTKCSSRLLYIGQTKYFFPCLQDAERAGASKGDFLGYRTEECNPSLRSKAALGTACGGGGRGR